MESSIKQSHQNQSFQPIIKQRIKNIIDRTETAQSISHQIHQRITTLKSLLTTYDLSVDLCKEDIKELKNSGLIQANIYQPESIEKIVKNVNHLKSNFQNLKQQSQAIFEVSKEPETVDHQISKTTQQIQENVELLESTVGDLHDKSKSAISEISSLHEKLDEIQQNLDDSKIQNMNQIRKNQLELYKIKGKTDLMAHAETKNRVLNLLEKSVNLEIKIKEQENQNLQNNLSSWLEQIQYNLKTENLIEFPASSSDLKLVIAKESAISQELKNKEEEILSMLDNESLKQKYETVVNFSQQKLEKLTQNLELAEKREKFLSQLYVNLNEKEVELLKNYRQISGLPDWVKKHQESLEDFKFSLDEISCLDFKLTDEEQNKFENRMADITALTSKYDKSLKENLERAEEFLRIKNEIQHVILETEEQFSDDIENCLLPEQAQVEKKLQILEGLRNRVNNNEIKSWFKNFDKIAERIIFDSNKSEMDKIEKILTSTKQDYQH